MTRLSRVVRVLAAADDIRALTHASPAATGLIVGVAALMPAAFFLPAADPLLDPVLLTALVDRGVITDLFDINAHATSLAGLARRMTPRARHGAGRHSRKHQTAQRSAHRGHHEAARDRATTPEHLSTTVAAIREAACGIVQPVAHRRLPLSLQTRRAAPISRASLLPPTANFKPG